MQINILLHSIIPIKYLLLLPDGGISFVGPGWWWWYYSVLGRRG
jgi:hypothetical protein